MNDRFRAYRIHSEGGRIGGRFEDIGLEDLSPGDVVIRVSHSGINYKDALAATGAGKILRRYPLVGGIDFARTSKFVEAAGVRAVNVHAADADGDRFDRDLRAAFRIGDGGANRFRNRVLIGDAALRPSRRWSEAVAKIADEAAFERADHAARSRATRIETNNQLRFRGHAYSTAVIRSSRRRSSVAAFGKLCLILL